MSKTGGSLDSQKFSHKAIFLIIISELMMPIVFTVFDSLATSVCNMKETTLV